MSEPNDVQELIGALREHQKLKYIGDCKCGECQLVPLVLVARAATTLAALSARIEGLEKLVGEIDDRLKDELEHSQFPHRRATVDRGVLADAVILIGDFRRANPTRGPRYMTPIPAEPR